MSRINLFSSVRPGNIYRNMVNGNFFEIAEALPDGTYRAKATDGSEAEAVITEQHLECSKFVKNDHPLPTPKKSLFSVSESGVLSYDGQVIQTGTLKIMGVLATYSGGARFLVRGLDGKTVDIFDYDAVNDHFEKLAGEFVDVTSFYEDEDGVYAYLVEKEEEFEQYVDESQETTEKATSLEQTVFFCIGKAKIQSFSMRDYPLGSFMKKTIFDEKPYQYGARADVVLEMRSSKKFERVTDVDDYTHYVVKDINDEGESQFVRQFIIEKTVQEGEGLWVTVKENGWFFDANILSITVSEDWDRSLFVITEKGIVYTNNGYFKRVAMGPNVVEVAKKHPILVALKPGNNHNEFVLANDEYEVVTIKVTKTEDRGYITEIVDGVAD